MKYALNLADDGRVLSVTREQYAPIGSVLMDELPDGNVADYRYANGEYVYDPRPVPAVEKVPTDTERITELEEALAMLLNGVTE